MYHLPHELPNDLRIKILELRSHGIFTAGRAFMPTQEKKKN